MHDVAILEINNKINNKSFLSLIKVGMITCSLKLYKGNYTNTYTNIHLNIA